MNILTFLPYLVSVFSLLAVIGSYIALRSGYSKEAQQIQDRVIVALRLEIDTLRVNVKDAKDALAQLRQSINTVKNIFEKRGTTITINGEYVTVYDAHTGTTVTAPIKAVASAEDTKNSTSTT